MGRSLSKSSPGWSERLRRPARPSRPARCRSGPATCCTQESVTMQSLKVKCKGVVSAIGCTGSNRQVHGSPSSTVQGPTCKSWPLSTFPFRTLSSALTEIAKTERAMPCCKPPPELHVRERVAHDAQRVERLRLWAPRNDVAEVGMRQAGRAVAHARRRDLRSVAPKALRAQLDLHACMGTIIIDALIGRATCEPIDVRPPNLACMFG